MPFGWPKFVAILAFIYLTLHACLAGAAISKPFLYQVMKGGEVHYVLGTYHSAIHWSEFPKSVTQAFIESKTVILEIDYPEDYRSALNDTFSDLMKVMPRYEHSQRTMNRLRRLRNPEEFIPFLSDSDCMGALIYPHIQDFPYYHLDGDIFFRAKDSGKLTLRLDEPNATDDITSTTENCSISMILKYESPEKLFRMGRETLRRYRAGDETMAYREIMDANIARRNALWMPKILSSFQQSPSFVAVGIGHLFGPNGLLVQLSNNGYVVKRVNSDI